VDGKNDLALQTAASKLRDMAVRPFAADRNRQKMTTTEPTLHLFDSP
jgi:hypothetical protein